MLLHPIGIWGPCPCTARRVGGGEEVTQSCPRHKGRVAGQCCRGFTASTAVHWRRFACSFGLLRPPGDLVEIVLKAKTASGPNSCASIVRGEKTKIKAGCPLSHAPRLAFFSCESGCGSGLFSKPRPCMEGHDPATESEQSACPLGKRNAAFGWLKMGLHALPFLFLSLPWLLCNDTFLIAFFPHSFFVVIRRPPFSCSRCVWGTRLVKIHALSNLTSSPSFPRAPPPLSS